MKTMVSHSVALFLVGATTAWSSSFSDVSVGANTLDSAVRAIIRDQEFGEDREHHQLEHWCNTTVIGQTNRRSALLRLLVQSQSVSLSKDGGAGSDVLHLEQQAATLGVSLEQKRLAAQASQSMQKQQIASLQLYADDASKDVEALQRVWEHLGGVNANGQDPSAQVVARLFAEAKKTVKERQAKLAWVQAGEQGLDISNMSKLETEYRNKKAAILNLEHQQYATQRSLDVLSAALEDESAYLSDLQSICSAEKRVHERVETRVLPALRGVPKLVAATSEVQEVPAAAGKSPKLPRAFIPAVAVTPSLPAAKVAKKLPTPQAKLVAVAAEITTTQRPELHIAAKKMKTKSKVRSLALKPKHRAAKPKHQAAPTPVAPPPVTTTTQEPAQEADTLATEATDVAPTSPPPAHHKKKPPPPPDHRKKAHHAVPLAKEQEHKVSTTVPTTTPAPPAASEDEFDMPSTTTSASLAKKVAHAKKVTKKAKGTAFIDSVYSGVGTPAETGQDLFDGKEIEAPTPQPPHKKKLQVKKEDAMSDDDSDFDKDVKMLDAGTQKLKEDVPSKPPATPEFAAAPDDSFAELVPTPAPHNDAPSKKKKKLRSKKQDTFLDGVYSAAAGNLPTAYAAWSPDSTPSATSAPSQNSELKALEADFDSDDDAPTPAPKRRHKHRHHHEAPAPAPPVTHTMKGDDGVVYDDDDLPKHHRSSFSGLEGGWQSFMKKNKKKAKKAKLDPDVAIMESLYTKDGGLPSQYTAWTPDSAPAAPKDEAPAKPKMFDDGDLASAAKDLQNDDDNSFFQVAAEDQLVDSVTHLIHQAIAPRRRASTSFLEAAVSDSDKSGALAAGMVLDRFAEVLHSQPLQQLSKAHLSQSKLSDLFRQLRDVDPLTHKSNSGAAAHGKQAQAEQWCLYFQRHVETATPMQQAVARVEAASSELAKAVSYRAALLEEVNARTQLQRTVEKDVERLTSLSKSMQQEPDAKLHSFQQHLATRVAGGKAAATVAAAAERSHAGREELHDLLEGALQKRTSVLKSQQTKLADLQMEINHSDVEVSKKKAVASSAQAGIETVRAKLSGIQASCDDALSAMEHRRHAGHMEAHAIELALQVLGNQ